MDYMGLVLTRASQWLEQWFASTTTVESESLDDVELVEFVDGPLDGYRHAVDATRIYHLPPTLVLPISAPRIARLEGADGDCDASDPPSSFAMYDLVPHGVDWRYRYCPGV